jgi:hypothetical protein
VNAVTFSSIPTTYEDLLIEVLGASHNGGASQSLQIELSGDNGTNWTGAVPISGTTAVAASVVLYGSAEIPAYKKAAGVVSAGTADLPSNVSITSVANLFTSRAWRISAGINAIRISWTGSANFDAGSLKLHGK